MSTYPYAHANETETSCVYVYVYVYVFVYVYVHVEVDVDLAGHVHVHVYVRVCAHVHVQVYMCSMYIHLQLFAQARPLLFFAGRCALAASDPCSRDLVGIVHLGSAKLRYSKLMYLARILGARMS